MGLGLHGGGLHVSRWLVSQGAQVRVTDLQPALALAATVRQLPKSRRLTLVLGRHRERDFLWAEVVVQNPGVPRQSPYLALARAHGAIIENEATIFFRLVGRERIVGVTGTRGKSTTAALTAAILRRAFPGTLLGGNIATVPMFAVIERARRRRSPVVLELSSWHLENLGACRVSPHVAVVTNVLPDHLNRYRSMTAYAEAKRQIFAHQEAGDFVVVNQDNPQTRRFKAALGVTRVGFSRRPRGVPPRAYVQDGWIWWRRNSRPVRVIPQNAVRISGAHNLENVLAAVAVAKIYGVPNFHIRAAVSAFGGLPYRQQRILTWRGVDYINDTAATTPEATQAALQTLGERQPKDRRRIVLIAGGSDKRLPRESFRRLADAIGPRCKAVILFDGEGSRRILSALRTRGYHAALITGVRQMADAVGLAAVLAAHGDTVLLSPACASFGLFQHEYDRGDQFNQCVKSLP